MVLTCMRIFAHFSLQLYLAIEENTEYVKFFQFSRQDMAYIHY